MNRKKIAWMLVLIMSAAVCLSACSLFGGGNSTDASGMPELSKRYYYAPGDYFIVNVKQDAPEDGSKAATVLCKASVALFTTEDMTEVLAQNQPAIRNLITRILRDQTEAEARADDAIDRLQTTMTEQLAELLNMEEFRALYISDYVVQ